MCGILGMVALAPERIPDLKPILDTIAYRGPDGEGFWRRELESGGAISFAHRRLSIIDLSDAANQPMWDAAHCCVMIFNGEIYNYIEVRNELASQGVAFATHSDSEVILEAYKRWGVNCVDRLNGMFAFAIFDQRSKKLFCARDRYGEKPFLYAAKPGFFAFASEFKALLRIPGIGPNHDEFRLLQAAVNPSVGLDTDRQTVFDDIQQLLPGEALEVDTATLAQRVWRYYTPSPDRSPNLGSEADIFLQFRELLTDAVRIRMRSDVEVGSCLSGGLDSSAIVCIARRSLGIEATYHTFTGRFPGTYADESAYAQRVVDYAGVQSHQVEPTVDGFIDDLPEFMWHNELPVSSASQYAQWCVFRLAKQHRITVLLDGQGSDEVLGGYEQYFAQYIQSLEDAGDTERLQRELPLIRERYPLALANPTRSLKDRLPFAARHLIASQFGGGSNVAYAMKFNVARRVTQTAGMDRLAQFHPLSNALAQDSFGRFLTTLLRYGDRNSMAHSREVRLPFCDHRIADFVLGLPAHLIMGEIQTKRMLRESMVGILPEEIRTRWNKQGFRPPQDLWFKSARFKTLVRDTLSTTSFRHSPWWNSKSIDRLLRRIEAGEIGLGWTVWQPFIIEMWRTHFVERLAGHG